MYKLNIDTFSSSYTLIDEKVYEFESFESAIKRFKQVCLEVKLNNFKILDDINYNLVYEKKIEGYICIVNIYIS